MTDLSDRLKTFVEHWADRGVVWGDSDCSAWVAKWVNVATGKVVPLPVYSTQREAHRLIASIGGLDKLWTKTLAPLALPTIGFFDLADIELGNIGVVETRDEGSIGVISAGNGIMVRRTPNGCGYYRPKRDAWFWRLIP